MTSWSPELWPMMVPLAGKLWSLTPRPHPLSSQGSSFFPETSSSGLNFKKPLKPTLSFQIGGSVFFLEVPYFLSPPLSPLNSYSIVPSTLFEILRPSMYFFPLCLWFREHNCYLWNKLIHSSYFLHSFDCFLFFSSEHLSERNYTFKEIKCFNFFLSMLWTF